MQAYAEAIAGQHQDDVFIAVDRLVRGKVDRNHEFIPAPAQLSAQIGKAMNERLDDLARNKPRLAPSQTDKGTAEERKAAVAKIMVRYRPMSKDHAITQEEDAKKRRQALLECAIIAKDEDAISTLKAEDSQIKFSEQSLKALGLQRSAA
jgi:hypothetical protein